MPAHDSPAVLVARFLKSSQYLETLDAFLLEAQLPVDAGSTNKGDLTIERVLEEKKQYDISVDYEKVGEAHELDWSLPAPAKPEIVDLPSTASYLHAVIVGQSNDDAQHVQHLVATSTDRQITILNTEWPYQKISSTAGLHQGPSLYLSSLLHGIVVSVSLSGEVTIAQLSTEGNLEKISSRQDHAKHAIQVISHTSSYGTLLATAGWDGMVFIYYIEDRSQHPQLPSPIASLKLPTNPLSILFVRDPDSPNQQLYLIVSRRDSTNLYYYAIRENVLQSDHSSPDEARPPLPDFELSLTGKQNLTPHSTGWISFSPSCLALCPTDPTLLAVGTSSLPHMKVLFVRLLFPTTSSNQSPSAAATQASQARAELEVANREEAAIQAHINTFAPQTEYSNPVVVWRPDGSEVFINGDDGCVRGVGTRSGKVESVLKDGHEAGSKVRGLWSGMVGGEEWLVSGGFDKRIVVWRF